MISYSDYVLSENPWAYWPLNDVSLFGLYGENQKIMDVTGNDRHLVSQPTDKVHFNLAFSIRPDVPNFPADSLPIRGISVDGKVTDTSLYAPLSEGTSLVYLPKAAEAHRSDVSPEATTVSHQLKRRKVRAEFLLNLPPLSAQNSGGNCSTVQYPIFVIGRNVFMGSNRIL